MDFYSKWNLDLHHKCCWDANYTYDIRLVGIRKKHSHLYANYKSCDWIINSFNWCENLSTFLYVDSYDFMQDRNNREYCRKIQYNIIS